MKKALIVGITGQDGSYLAELLLEKGYEVHGIIRRSSSFNTGRLTHIFQDSHEENVRLKLHYGDLADASCLEKLIDKVEPNEIYNLGAQSHVRVSFDLPNYTADIVGNGALRMLEAIKNVGALRNIRYYQASSSEMYGKVMGTPQSEKTPFYPRSPYACAKVFAYWITVNYRESYGLHASNGILFNHESPRRGETFVTRKITMGLANILAGKQKKLYLGNLDARRDWGFAKDYVEAMWMMTQQPQGDDFVISTGTAWRVRDFLDRAFGLVDLNWQDYVEIDSRYFRPAEVELLIGDPGKANKILGWKSKTSFDKLVEIMVREDLRMLGLEKSLLSEAVA